MVTEPPGDADDTGQEQHQRRVVPEPAVPPPSGHARLRMPRLALGRRFWDAERGTLIPRPRFVLVGERVTDGLFQVLEVAAGFGEPGPDLSDDLADDLRLEPGKETSDRPQQAGIQPVERTFRSTTPVTLPPSRPCVPRVTNCDSANSWLQQSQGMVTER